jgi:hypothetical protein
MTHYLEKKMDKLDIPPLPEFLEIIADTGAGLYGCKPSCDLFELRKDDLIDQVKDIITVGEVLRAGGRGPGRLHLTAPWPVSFRTHDSRASRESAPTCSATTWP